MERDRIILAHPSVRDFCRTDISFREAILLILDINAPLPSSKNDSDASQLPLWERLWSTAMVQQGQKKFSIGSMGTISNLNVTIKAFPYLW